MGMSHAKAYTRIDGFDFAGLCARGVHAVAGRRNSPARRAFTSFDEALAATQPDVVSINTFPDTHADYAIEAMEAGAHVFVEKPLAETRRRGRARHRDGRPRRSASS